MPRRTVRLTHRRSCKPCSGGRRKRSSVTARRGRRRLKNSKHLRKWMSHRAKPWMVRGRGFWEDFGRGFLVGFQTICYHRRTHPRRSGKARIRYAFECGWKHDVKVFHE